jgi:hypothetical protein
MRGAHHARPKSLRSIERSDPLPDICLADEVVGTVHANVTRKQDSLLGQPRQSISVRVRDPQVHQLDAVFAAVENEILEKSTDGLCASSLTDDMQPA